MSEKELREIFSKNIKDFRIRNNWSQVALAHNAGVSVNFINDIESGKKWASPATMVKIADVFNIHVYELLKPPDMPPDNVNSIITKYTDNVYRAIEDARRSFIKEMI